MNSITWKLAILSMLVVPLGGCTSHPKIFQFERGDSAEKMVWPRAPETARYEYVGQITGEPNFVYAPGKGPIGIKRFFLWVAGIVTGKKVSQVLQRPQAVLVDEHGRIYVTDISRQGVIVFDAVRGQLFVYADAATGQRFKTPLGMARNAEGQLWVADADLGFVSILDKNGLPKGKLSHASLKRPVGVALDEKSGWIYVADAWEHNIKVFHRDGQLLKTIAKHGEGPGELNGPTYISLLQDKLYVSDTLNARVQIFSKEGKFLQKIGQRGQLIGDFSKPKGIALDRHRHVYIVDSLHDHLLVYDERGQFLLPIGGEGSEIGQFYLPAGVFVDGRNQIYIADMFNSRVVVLRYLEGV